MTSWVAYCFTLDGNTITQCRRTSDMFTDRTLPPGQVPPDACPLPKNYCRGRLLSGYDYGWG